MYHLLPFEPANKKFPRASHFHHLFDEPRMLPFNQWLSITESEKYCNDPGLDVKRGISADDLMVASAAFMAEPAWFDRGGTLGWSCTSGRSAQRQQGRNMNVVVVGGFAAYHINKPPQCIILQPPGLDRCPEQRDWKSFESGLHCRTYVKWKLPTAQPVNTNQMGDAERKLLQV